MAVRNMALYACIEGNTIRVPATSTVDGTFAYKHLQERVLPRLPRFSASYSCQRDMPVNSDGVASIVTFIAPTFARESPVERTAKFTATAIQPPWNATRPKNPEQ